MAGWLRGRGMAVLGGMAVMLTGCGNFFVKPTTTTTTASSTSYAYVSNSASGTEYINGYVLTSGTLVAATSSPYSLGFVPQGMAVTPSNAYLYVGSDSALAAGAIYGYSIGTGGALTILNSGAALVSENSAAVDISPDGQWLFSLNTNGSTLEEYSINSSTGLLSFAENYTYGGAAGGVVTPLSVKVAPSGDFVVLALGTAGMVTFPFNTTTGAAGPGDTLVSPGSTSSGIYAVAVDSNNYLYASGTAGLQVFSTTTLGVPTLVSTTAYTIGKGPRAMVVNTGNNYVYTANQTDSTITGDAIGTGGVLTAIAGSPYTAPTTVTAMGRDNSGKYIVTAGYSATSGIQMFAIGTAGALTESSSAASGTDTTIPVAVALTH